VQFQHLPDENKEKHKPVTQLATGLDLNHRLSKYDGFLMLEALCYKLEGHGFDS
jgi:hypothetical protein